MGGRKICGSAQVRAGGAFLQHGSLLVDIDPVRTASVMGVSVDGVARTTTTLREQLGRVIGYEDLARLLLGAFEDTLGVRLVESGLSPVEEALKERLLSEKYSTDRWNLEGKGDPGTVPDGSDS